MALSTINDAITILNRVSKNKDDVKTYCIQVPLKILIEIRIDTESDVIKEMVKVVGVEFFENLNHQFIILEPHPFVIGDNDAKNTFLKKSKEEMREIISTVLFGEKVKIEKYLHDNILNPLVSGNIFFASASSESELEEAISVKVNIVGGSVFDSELENMMIYQAAKVWGKNVSDMEVLIRDLIDTNGKEYKIYSEYRDFFME